MVLLAAKLLDTFFLLIISILEQVFSILVGYLQLIVCDTWQSVITIYINSFLGLDIFLNRTLKTRDNFGIKYRLTGLLED